MTDPETIRQQSSMDYWYPKLVQCGVPTPETHRIKLRDFADAAQFSEGVPMPLVDLDEVAHLTEEVGGPPAFIRTDQASAKHSMASASRLDTTDLDVVEEQVFELLQHNEMAGFAGLPYTSLYVREWLNLNCNFQAFDETPIAAEIRVFINDGEIHDVGFYWPADAIEEHPRHTPSLPEDWRTRLAETREYALSRVDSDVVPLAENVASEFDGYWSVDFAETADGDWYCIDMAKGIASWHPDACEKPATHKE